MSREGWKRVAPGVYDGGDGAMHVDLAEFLRSCGMAVTERNEAFAIREIEKLLDEEGIPVEVRES